MQSSWADPIVIAIDDPTSSGQARRSGRLLAEQAGFSELDVERVSIIVTEICTNVLKHAGTGEALIAAVEGGIEVLGLDNGPGMENVRACLEDGYSTAGSQGSGLGAIRRISDAFDVFSRPGQGTVVFARVGRTPAADIRTGSARGPMPGETACGDNWAQRHESGKAMIMLADGLGHGVYAMEASRAAASAFLNARQGAAESIALLHDALKQTRGAAVGVATLDQNTRTVTYAGLGNISGAICGFGVPVRPMVSSPGTAGHQWNRVTEFKYPWPAGSIVILHSDGIRTHWRLEQYPGISCHHPSVIAGILYRDHWRQQDDGTVVAAGE